VKRQQIDFCEFSLIHVSTGLLDPIPTAVDDSKSFLIDPFQIVKNQSRDVGLLPHHDHDEPKHFTRNISGMQQVKKGAFDEHDIRFRAKWNKITHHCAAAALLFSFFRLAWDGSAKGGLLPESFSLFFSFSRFGHLATLEQNISEAYC